MVPADNARVPVCVCVSREYHPLVIMGKQSCYQLLMDKHNHTVASLSLCPFLCLSFTLSCTHSHTVKSAKISVLARRKCLPLLLKTLPSWFFRYSDTSYLFRDIFVVEVCVRESGKTPFPPTGTLCYCQTGAGVRCHSVPLANQPRTAPLSLKCLR